jgi:hypothetical protein
MGEESGAVGDAWPFVVYRGDAAKWWPVVIGKMDRDVSAEARELLGLDVPLVAVRERVARVELFLWPESVPVLSGTRALKVAVCSHAVWASRSWVELVRQVVGEHAARRVGAPVQLRYASGWFLFDPWGTSGG